MTASPSIHSVHIYEDSAALISRLCAIVSSSLRSGDTVLIIATAEHREQLLTDLQDCGLDVRYMHEKDVT
jgi:uroporphyrinogen-III synthase